MCPCRRWMLPRQEPRAATHGSPARQTSPSGAKSNVGLEVMPADGVTLSDGYCPGVRAPTRSVQLRGSFRTSGKAPGMGVRMWRRLSCRTVGTGAAGASVRGMERSVHDAFGGSAALVRLAAAGHRWCLQDPMVSHAFCQPRCLVVPGSVSTLPAEPPSRPRLLPPCLDLDRLLVPDVAWASAH